MRADDRFRGLPKAFWANVRTVSEVLGYTNRKTGDVRVHSGIQIAEALQEAGLGVAHLDGGGGIPMGQRLADYFAYRAESLNAVVRPSLMNASEAKAVFEKLRAELNPKCPIPNNKQKGDKAGPNYLTGIVNMLVEARMAGLPVDFDPRKLTSFTAGQAPLRTLARRVDGCFPGTTNPIALWEIKEYYYTTTFGSRVADGVYETLLDGMELEELRENEGIKCDHVLIIDSYDTWWGSGRSYLCRIVDMLNMGYVDEVLCGREAETRLPELVAGWQTEYARRVAAGV